MKVVLIGLLGLPIFSCLAGAQARYDHKLEDAVKAVIANKIGDIRPGFAMSGAPQIDRPSSAGQEQSSPPKSWEIVDGDMDFKQTASGSFQTFTDGSVATPEQRKSWANKTVSRVVNF